MDKDTKIYVAGHRGLVGSAIWNNLQERGYHNLVGRTHKELNLLDGVAVKKFFDEEQPEAVVLAAAHVGGIMANLQYRADFIYEICKFSKRHRRKFPPRSQEAALFGKYLHLPQRGTATHERRMLADIAVGIHQRTLCHSQNCRTENV